MDVRAAYPFSSKKYRSQTVCSPCAVRELYTVPCVYVNSRFCIGFPVSVCCVRFNLIMSLFPEAGVGLRVEITIYKRSFMFALTFVDIIQYIHK